MRLNSDYTAEYGDNTQPPDPNNEENQEELEGNNISDEDVERLNDQLDELNNALDLLEQKNENIQARLKELLQSSRELRNDVHKDCEN